MKVKEVIAMLEGMNPEAAVCIVHGDMYEEVLSMSIRLNEDTAEDGGSDHPDILLIGEEG